MAECGVEVANPFGFTRFAIIVGEEIAEQCDPVVSLPLRQKINSVLGRLDYCRVRVSDGAIEPLAISGASVLSSLTRANGFVLVPPNSEGFAEDETVEVHLFDWQTASK